MNYADKEAVEYDGPANPDRVGYPSDEESDEDDCGCCDPHCPCDGHKQLRFL